MIAGGRFAPDWSRYFDHINVCGATLCVSGIVPGETPWNDALGVLSVPQTQSLSFSTWSGVIGRTNLFVIGKAVNEHGQSTPELLQAFVPSAPSLTTGALIARYGDPCFVVFQYVVYNSVVVPNFTLYYPFATATINSFPGRPLLMLNKELSLAASDPVSLESYDLTSKYRGLTTCAEVNTTTVTGSVRWYGFGGFHLYSPDA